MENLSQSEDLLKHLDRLIPERCPSLNAQDREIWFYSGKRAVVHLIRQLLEEASTEVLRE